MLDGQSGSGSLRSPFISPMVVLGFITPPLLQSEAMAGELRMKLGSVRFRVVGLLVRTLSIEAGQWARLSNAI